MCKSEPRENPEGSPHVPDTGGGADAGYASRTGKLVVLKSQGLAGRGDNARDEYIEYDTIVPRLYLRARLLMNLGREQAELEMHSTPFATMDAATQCGVARIVGACPAVNDILATSFSNVDCMPPLDSRLTGSTLTYRSFCLPQAATRERPQLVVKGRWTSQIARPATVVESLGGKEVDDTRSTHCAPSSWVQRC